MTECEKWIEAVLKAPPMSIDYWWTDGFGKGPMWPSISFARNQMIRQLLRAAREMEENNGERPLQ